MFDASYDHHYNNTSDHHHITTSSTTILITIIIYYYSIQQEVSTLFLYTIQEDTLQEAQAVTGSTSREDDFHWTLFSRRIQGR
jgi:nanoRNase/pAp phosphatase (c-di-AMP/oligoRNAs hydrolase)